MPRLIVYLLVYEHIVYISWPHSVRNIGPLKKIEKNILLVNNVSCKKAVDFLLSSRCALLILCVLLFWPAKPWTLYFQLSFIDLQSHGRSLIDV